MSTPISKTVTVRNAQGLHMRPANALVELASRFDSKITIGNGGDAFDCKSMLSLMTLGAEDGSQWIVTTDGQDSGTALDQIAAFFESGFETDNENN